MTAPVRRPVLVTVLLVLVVISGVLSILGGIVIVLARNNAEVVAATDGSSTVGLWLGILAIVVGLLYLAVAKGLASGNNGSRVVVAVVSVINIAAGLYVALTQHGNAVYSGWSSVFWGVVILAILYSPSANAFFARRG